MPLTAQEERELEELEFQKLSAEREAALANSPQAKAPRQEIQKAALTTSSDLHGKAGSRKRTAFDPIASPDQLTRDRRLLQTPGGAATMQRLYEDPAERAKLAQIEANLARYAPAVAATVAAPAGLTGVVLRSLAGGAGEAAAQFIEGGDPLSRKGAGAVANAAILTGAPMMKANPAQGWVGASLQGIKTGAAAGATQALADTVQRTIDPDPEVTYKNVADALKHTWVPTVLGGLTGAPASRFAGIASRKPVVDESRKTLEAVGIAPEHQTAAMLDPTTKNLAAEMRLAKTSHPGLAIQMGEAQNDVVRKARATIGEVLDESEVADRIEKSGILTKLDRTSKAYDDAVKAEQAAVQNFEKARLLQAPPELKEKVRLQAEADLLTTLNEQAKRGYEINANVGDLVTLSDKAAQVTQFVNKLADTKSAIAGSKMDSFFEEANAFARASGKQGGVSSTTPFLSKQDLMVEAAAGMGDQAKTESGRALLKKIAEYGSPDQAQLSLVEFQDLRNELSKAFAGVTDPKAATAGEALATRAYGAMGGSNLGTIRANFGDRAAEKYSNFVTFWRESSQLRDSQLGRSLLNKEDVMDSTLESLANGFLSGKMDELNQFKKFVSVLDKDSPGLAKMATDVMGGALREAMIWDAVKKGDDFKGLFDKLVRMERVGELPVPIENLRFGNIESIKAWRGTLDTFKPGEINGAVLDRVLTNPEVQRAMGLGSKETRGVLMATMAREAFNTKVAQKVSAEYAGLTADARRATDDAQRLAQRAKMTAEDMREAYEAAQRDPVYRAFSGVGGELSHVLGAKGGEGTITDLVMRMPKAVKKTMMDGLRKKDPQIAEVIENRMLADTFEKMTVVDRTTPKGRERFDLPEISAFFAKKDGPVETLRLTIGPEKMKQVESFVTNLAKVDDNIRRGRFPTEKEMEAVVKGTALATAMKTGTRLGYAHSVFRDLMDWRDAKAYNLLSRAITDPEIAEAYFARNQNVSDALSSLPAQKAYLLANDAAFQEDVKKVEAIRK